MTPMFWKFVQNAGWVDKQGTVHPLDKKKLVLVGGDVQISKYEVVNLEDFLQSRGKTLIADVRGWC